MNNKKLKIFLCIALIFFTLTVVLTVNDLQMEYYQIKSDFSDDYKILTHSTAVLYAVAIVFVFPIFAVELSCIRSVYKLLKYNPCGVIKVCYLISAILSFLSFTLYCLIHLKIVGFKTGVRESVLLVIEWPIFIVSFILGSIPIKHND